MKNLLIRADAGPQIGTGHVMRCLALAQAWQDTGGRTTFAMAMDAPAIEARLKAEGMHVVRLEVDAGGTDDVAHTVDLARKLEAQVVVVDGYHFGADYQRTIKDAALPLLFIDDNGHASHYYADLVLNQNLHADSSLYTNREPYTQLLLGTRYVLLHRQFLKWRGWKREIPDRARKVLITLGGGDPDNVTGKVLKALASLDAEIKVAVGGSNSHVEHLKVDIRQLKNNAELIVDATNMPDLMSWADVAVAAGGTTSWELAFMGLPSLVLVLADNQQAVADALDSAGAASKTTLRRVAAELDALAGNVGKRRAMSQRGRRLVDGSGARRVVMKMAGVPFRLRQAREEDCKMLWQWVNEPEVRSSAFSSEPILWESHAKWFERKLNARNCRIFIGVDEADTPFGQVRFDWNEVGDAEVDVSLVKSKRNVGLGTSLLDEASKKIFQESPVQMIHAYIKVENVKSLHAFERAGFKKIGVDAVHGHHAIHFIRESRDE